MRFVCCNEKTLTNDKNKNIEFETQKKVAVRNQKKKCLLIWGVTFPLSQDSELGDKDLNDLVEESEVKNTKKYTTPFK